MSALADSHDRPDRFDLKAAYYNQPNDAVRQTSPKSVKRTPSNASSNFVKRMASGASSMADEIAADLAAVPEISVTGARCKTGEIKSCLQVSRLIAEFAPDAATLRSMAFVSRAWYRASQADELWKRQFLRLFDLLYHSRAPKQRPFDDNIDGDRKELQDWPSAGDLPSLALPSSVLGGACDHARGWRLRYEHLARFCAWNSSIYIGVHRPPDAVASSSDEDDTDSSESIDSSSDEDDDSDEKKKPGDQRAKKKKGRWSKAVNPLSDWRPGLTAPSAPSWSRFDGSKTYCLHVIPPTSIAWNENPDMPSEFECELRGPLGLHQAARASDNLNDKNKSMQGERCQGAIAHGKSSSVRLAFSLDGAEAGGVSSPAGKVSSVIAETKGSMGYHGRDGRGYVERPQAADVVKRVFQTYRVAKPRPVVPTTALGQPPSRGKNRGETQPDIKDGVVKEGMDDETVRAALLAAIDLPQATSRLNWGLESLRYAQGSARHALNCLSMNLETVQKAGDGSDRARQLLSRVEAFSAAMMPFLSEEHATLSPQTLAAFDGPGLIKELLGKLPRAPVRRYDLRTGFAIRKAYQQVPCPVPMIWQCIGCRQRFTPGDLAFEPKLCSASACVQCRTLEASVQPQSVQRTLGPLGPSCAYVCEKCDWRPFCISNDAIEKWRGALQEIPASDPPIETPAAHAARKRILDAIDASLPVKRPRLH